MNVTYQMYYVILSFYLFIFLTKNYAVLRNSKCTHVVVQVVDNKLKKKVLPQIVFVIYKNNLLWNISSK